MPTYHSTIEGVFQQLRSVANSNGAPQRDFLHHILERHHHLGGHTEFRLIEPGRRAWSGLFGPEHETRLLRDLAPRKAGFAGGEHPRAGECIVCFGMNPVMPECRRAPRGRFECGAAIKAENIHAYATMVIDVDPIRAVHGESATDAEKARARAVAMSIAIDLDAVGLRVCPADSGNGFHLLIPLRPDPGSPVLAEAGRVKALLRLLARRYDTVGAEVDQSTHDASRVLKLYGTPAIKGAPTEDRPHRLSAILVAALPEDVALTEVEAAIQAVVGRPAREKATNVPPGTGSNWASWRKAALERLPLDAVYGDLLTGAEHPGWLVCRDPASPSGDRHPSAGVADGNGSAERGAFHSFRTGSTIPVFDFLIERGVVSDFPAAVEHVARLSGVPTPNARTGSRPAVKPGAPTAPSRPVVAFDNVRDTLETVHRGITDTLVRTGRFFRYGRAVVEIEGGRPPVPVTRANLAGKFAAEAEYARVEATKDGELLRYAPLPVTIAASWDENTTQRRAFPELRSYLWVPSFTSTWRWLGAPGHDPESGLYYSGPTVKPEAAARDLLGRLTGEFPWRTPADRTNYIGAMLTLVTLAAWPEGHPLVFIVGNKPRLGKSRLARILGILADGEEPRVISYSTRDEEFEKRLATGFAVGRHVMFIDNVRSAGALGSQALEAAVVSPRPSFRRLGTNDVISREVNDVVFCMTVNRGFLDRDLAERMLPVRLHFDGDPTRRSFEGDDPVDVALRERPALLSALAHMVQSWREAGSPPAPEPHRHSTNERWARAIGAILHHAGFADFLSNFEEAQESVDPTFPLILAVAALWEAGAGFTADWVSRIEEAGIEGLWRPEGSQRSRETSLAHHFSGYIGRIFQVSDHVQVQLEATAGEKTTYRFRRLRETSETCQTSRQS